MPDGSLQPMHFEGFQPDATNQRPFRDALGQFATGVTIVTAAGQDGPLGMTANSFSSVSLDPPLVLWCPAKSSARFQSFVQAKHFAIHVLSAEQCDVALAFAKSGQAFEGLDVDINSQGVPVFSQCLARFECDTRAVHDAGDHAIVVGQVSFAGHREGTPLVFSQGRFRAFDKEA